MPDKLWTVRVVLGNGETHDLAGADSAEEAVARLIDYEKREREFVGDRCNRCGLRAVPLALLEPKWTYRQHSPFSVVGGPGRSEQAPDAHVVFGWPPGLLI